MADVKMFVVTGVTGQVGNVVARTLVGMGQHVRAVARNATKAQGLAKAGCEIAVADLDQTESLARAFAGAEGVFVLLPPTFAPSAGFPEARKTIRSITDALLLSKPRKVVALSTIGAQAKETNLLTQLQLLEQSLAALPMPVAFLRAGWFMENFQWDTASAKSGTLPSFLQPPDRRIPMVATADVGRVAAEMLASEWEGHKVVELEGPTRVSPNMAAEAFAKILGHPVRAEAIPRVAWAALFASQGSGNHEPRMRMLDGFNEGWIRFESANPVRGTTTLDTVLRGLLARTS